MLFMCENRIQPNEYKYYTDNADKAKFKSPEEELEYAKSNFKKCIKCGELCSLDNFKGNTSGSSPFDKNGYRYRRGECISCSKKYQKGKSTAIKLAKLNGLPTKAPEGAICGICGRGDNLCFDHNHTGDNSFRGWLCNGCNISIGILSSHGKRTEFDAIMDVLKYLVNNQKSNDIKSEYIENLTNMVNSLKEEGHPVY